MSKLITNSLIKLEAESCARNLKLDRTIVIVSYEPETDTATLIAKNNGKQIEVTFSYEQLLGTLDDLNIYQHMKQLLSRDQSFIVNDET